jgi:hypothetical protein
MTTSRADYPLCAAWAVLALTLGTGVAHAGDDSPANTPPKSLPQSGLFSSLKQAVKQGYDQEVVRGTFVQGTPPNQHRYYCLVDVKTGQKETNAVVGQPVPLPSGMTGIKADSVSLYLCADAEREGMLDMQGFLLTGPAARANASSAPATNAGSPPAAASAPPAAAARAGTAAMPAVAAAAPVAAAALAPSPPAATTAAPAAADAAAAAPATLQTGAIDVAGVRLGMSADEVRAVLRSKRLREYRESAETLSTVDRTRTAVLPIKNGRFVNVIAAWTGPPMAAEGNLEADGESYEVVFTPVPGHERVMAVIHTIGYSAPNAIRESVLESALARKYGGGSAAALTQSPTWRVLAGGRIEAGDACGRRATFGGLAALHAGAPRENAALKLGADELRSQVDHCGVALITEDQYAVNGGALREDRVVTRFTVTAYSPELALEGARAAAQLIGTGAVDKAAGLAAGTPGLPEL